MSMMRANPSLRLVATRAEPRPRAGRAAAVDRTEPIEPARTGWFTADLGRLLGAASFWGFAFSSFYLLPKFLTQELAAGPADVGLVVGILSVATVLATPFAGWVVDHFPRRYAVIAGGVLMAVAAAGFVGVRRLGWLLDVLRVIQGLSYALVVTAVGTLVTDVVPRERLNQALGLSGASMLVMNALAPAIAEPLAAAAGWQVVFGVAALAAAGAALLAARIREPHWTRHAATGGLRQLLAQPLARHYAVVMALAGATFGTVFTFEPTYALALGRTKVGGFFVAYAAAAIFVRVGLGGLPSRVGIYRIARGALLAYAAVVFGLAVAPPAAFELLGALFGMAHGLFFPALNAIAVLAVRPHERGRIIAIFSGAFAFGLSAGSSALGWVASQAGYPIVFVIAGCGTLAAVAVLVVSPALRAAGHAMPVLD